MKKKKIIISAIAIFLVIAISVVSFAIFDNKNGDESANEPITPKSWILVDTLSKLQYLIDCSDVSVEYDGDYVYINGLTFADGEAQYSYRLDEDENISELSIGYMIVAANEQNDEFIMEEIDSQEFLNKTTGVLEWVSEVLDVKVGNNFSIFSASGPMLDVAVNESYQQILDGTAWLELRILDTDCSVWVLSIEKIPGYNFVSCSLKHCSADSEEAKIPCNISIE